MITELARKLFARRIAEIGRYAGNAEEIQRKQLEKLLQKARTTEFGRLHGFAGIHSAEEFARHVPVCTYEQMHGYAERMARGEKNVLWPGRVVYYAQSSGTTDARSKYIPVSEDSFRTMHYRGGVDTVAIYLSLNPKSRMLDGKGLILGAGQSVVNPQGSHLGLLSGLLVEHANPLLNLIRVPRFKTAMIPDFARKMELMIPEIIRKNVVSCSGIPSWYQLLFLRILQETGRDNISEIWPNLEVFIHGGVSFGPYREMFRSLVKSPDMHYLEVYNASEGFFSIQNDFADPAMLLMLDYGTYYEFMPAEEWGKEQPEAVPLWQVELGKTYAMVISNNSGLWRYNIGDTVTFTSLSPYKFVISGRTKHFLNLCGEEVMVGNADAAIAKACAVCGATVSNYTASVLLPTRMEKARHQWLVEFEQPPVNPKRFIHVLDDTLRALNSDYDSKRTDDIALAMPELVVAHKGLFTAWMQRNGKMGGQQKVPRLSQQRALMDELLALDSKMAGE